MKDLCRMIGLLIASILTVWAVFRLADRFSRRFRKNYITIESEHVHI